MVWFTKAANNGKTEAMSEIGFMYQNGIGATKSIRTAITWYTKAANQGDKNAQYKLAYIYKNEGEFKDLQKAVDCYQKAADNGGMIAKVRVKELNRQGYYAKRQKSIVYFHYICLFIYFKVTIIKNNKLNQKMKLSRAMMRSIL
jgi:TPR repeat protein